MQRRLEVITDVGTGHTTEAPDDPLDRLQAALSSVRIQLRPFDMEDISWNLLERSRVGFVRSDRAVAFVLQHREHWWTIRRFGRDGPSHSQNGPIWYALDPYKQAPVRLAASFVGDTLREAHHQGYAVLRAEPDADDETGEDFLSSTADEMVSARLTGRARTPALDE